MELRPGYKQTEVGRIPDDWNTKTIDEIGFVTSGKRLPLGSSLTEQETPHPYIRVTDMRPGTVSLSDIRFVPDHVYPAIKRYRIFRDDIFISVAGSLGIVGKIPDELDGANLTENADRITNISCSRDYLLYVLMSPLIQNTIESLQTVGAQPKLALTRIRKFVIPLPDTRAEQEAIAEALSDVDALIASLDELITKKRSIKQGTMQQLLTGKKRLPVFSEKWEVKRLGAVADIVRGASPRPIEDPKWFNENSSTGWVRISDVTKSNKYLFETSQKLSELGVINSRYVTRKNLIMSICATVGRPILNEIDVCIHDGFVVYRNPQIDKEYLYYFLSFIEKDWSKNGQTGSQMNLNTTLINTTEIYFPKDKSEQTAIATVLSDMDAEITAIEARRDKTKTIKQGMMQALLTGRIRLI
ncbi:restriction endonuclease subunit S [Methylobacter svalbardensis]|uniref:restriction endonuclease subunit S n=1 Tax=Methylobacter svalbardensis TaxID=3080016 RepID=UPI0030ED67CF